MVRIGRLVCQEAFPPFAVDVHIFPFQKGRKDVREHVSPVRTPMHRVTFGPITQVKIDEEEKSRPLVTVYSWIVRNETLHVDLGIANQDIIV